MQENRAQGRVLWYNRSTNRLTLPALWKLCCTQGVGSCIIGIPIPFPVCGGFAAASRATPTRFQIKEQSDYDHFPFPLGDVSFSAEYFSTLVGEATKQCYGVAAMTPRDLTDVVKSVVRGNDYSEKGVRVTQEEGRLVIELHIAVSYGLNISTAARSISHRVKDEVEQATGLKVARVIVSVDDVIA